MKTKQISYLMLCSRRSAVFVRAYLCVRMTLTLYSHYPNTHTHTVKLSVILTFTLFDENKDKCSKTLSGMRSMLQCRQDTYIRIVCLCDDITLTVLCTEHNIHVQRFVTVATHSSWLLLFLSLLHFYSLFIFFSPTSHV